MTEMATPNVADAIKAPLEQAASAMKAVARPPLNHSDRCDRCGAQGLVRVFLTTGDLTFCHHHYEENKEALAAVIFDTQDERERLLNVKPSPSANV